MPEGVEVFLGVLGGQVPSLRAFALCGTAVLISLLLQGGMEWLRTSPSLTPCSRHSHLHLVVLDAQDCVQLGFGCLQGWRLRHISGQPVQAFDHPILVSGHRSHGTLL